MTRVSDNETDVTTLKLTNEYYEWNYSPNKNYIIITIRDGDYLKNDKGSVVPYRKSVSMLSVHNLQLVHCLDKIQTLVLDLLCFRYDSTLKERLFSSLCLSVYI